jgi:predicted RNA binding protein YcfA (HicA-like mRNA interferase family)
MSNAEKRLADMRQNPRDWRIEDLELVAGFAGMKVRKSGGSHVVFSHPKTARCLSVPSKRPIKPVYVKHFVAMVDEVVDT